MLLQECNQQHEKKRTTTIKGNKDKTKDSLTVKEKSSINTAQNAAVEGWPLACHSTLLFRGFGSRRNSEETQKSDQTPRSDREEKGSAIDKGLFANQPFLAKNSFLCRRLNFKLFILAYSVCGTATDGFIITVICNRLRHFQKTVTKNQLRRGNRNLPTANNRTMDQNLRTRSASTTKNKIKNT